jgi:hypothetical protein
MEFLLYGDTWGGEAKGVILLKKPGCVNAGAALVGSAHCGPATSSNTGHFQPTAGGFEIPYR